MRIMNKKIAAAAALSVASLLSSKAGAASVTFTGAVSSTGTTLVWPYPNAITLPNTSNVTYYSLDATTANFTGGTGSLYTPGDAVTFNSTGTFLLAPQGNFSGGVTGNTNAPASLTFSGGSASTIYAFLRASTSAGSSDSAGFTSATAEYSGGNPLYPVNVSNPDSFSAGSPFASSTATGLNTNLTLDSTFLGKVIFRSRPGNSAPTGTVTINGGTLELNDSQALPGKATPTITLGGGTLVFNINTGRYASGDSNSNPATADYRSNAAALNVTQDSTIANLQVDDNGNSRFLSNAWSASINITAGKTLTFATGSQYTAIFPQQFGGTNASAGGITTVGSGYGTISLGTSNGVLRFGSAGTGSASTPTAQASGSTTTNFDAGSGSNTGAFLANIAFTSSGTTTFNMGGLTGGANTFVLGSAQASQNVAGLDVYSIGNLNLTQTFSGKITNGVGSSTRITGLAKVGSGTQTLGDNYFSGAINVTDATGTNTGTLKAGGARTLTDSNAVVTINVNATVDLNGNSPNAGKAITLAGGSLVNNGGSPVTLGTGTSASLTAGTTAGGVYTSPADAGLAGPTITLSGGGGSGASATALMHLVSVGNPGTRAAYTVAPIVTVSAPQLPGGRRAIVNALVDKTTGLLAFQMGDPGFGYTSAPTISLSGGTVLSGSTVLSTATVTVAVDSILLGTISGGTVTNTPGTGYTSAPTLTFAATGGGASQTTSAAGTAGFATVALTANSKVGGSGQLNINAPISGTNFGITKVGAGRTVLGGSNTYTGVTTINAGTLALGASNRIADTSNVTLAGGTLDTGGFSETAGTLNLTDNSTINFGEGSSILILSGIDGAYDTSKTLTIANWSGNANDGGGIDRLFVGGGQILSAAQLASIQFLVNYPDGGPYTTLQLPSGEIVPTPEPTSLGMIGFGAMGLLARRRRTKAKA